VRRFHVLRRASVIALGWLVLWSSGDLWGQTAKPPVSKAPKGEAKTPAQKRKPAAGVLESPAAASKPLLMRYARPETQESCVKVLTFYPKATPMLEIQCPWKQYTKPSVEVRLLLPDENDTPEVRPLAFVGVVMKGELTNAVYKAREDVSETPFVRSFPSSEGEFQVFGFKNQLQREAIHIVFLPATAGPNGGKASQATAAAQATAPADAQTPAPVRTTFYFLNAWAIDSETLRLELPAKHYGKAGRLRVWFLRDDSVLWQQTVPWPGMDGAK
jgi:hypothetical protein